MTEAEHREMFGAVESGDADEAAIACQRYLKRVRRSMENLRSEPSPTRLRGRRSR